MGQEYNEKVWTETRNARNTFFIVFVNPKTHHPSGVVGAGSLWRTIYINFLVW
jgi:hypothetical protein